MKGERALRRIEEALLGSSGARETTPSRVSQRASRLATARSSVWACTSLERGVSGCLKDSVSRGVTINDLRGVTCKA